METTTFFRLWHRPQGWPAGRFDGESERVLPHIRDFRTRTSFEEWRKLHAVEYKASEFVLRELPLSAFPHFMDEL